MPIRTSFTFFGVLVCLVVTAWAGEADEQRMLAETLPKDSVVWLELGTGSPDTSKSLAIYRRSAEKNSKGSVIILKNSVGNISSIHATLLDALAENLVKQGWHTLLVFMPPSANVNGQKRLEAAIAFLKKADAKNLVVVMVDKTAPVLTLLVNAKTLEDPFKKLVLLDAVNVEGEIKQPFMDVLSPTVAIVDVSLGEKKVDSPESIQREQRSVVAQQRNFTHYQKINIPLPSASAPAEDSWDIKRIQGWLEKP